MIVTRIIHILNRYVFEIRNGQCANSSQSDDDTSDEEKLNEQDKKKEEEAKAKAKEDSKLASGTSSKGTNTPSGRPKHTDPLKKKNLKRPGSPNLSESSGNESSRKKMKKKHPSQPSAITSAPGSRQISPAPSASGNGRKSSIVKLSVNSSKLSDIQSAPPNPSPTSAMSDGEATGGEMSDGGTRKPKIKLRIGGASPTGSRAGSPAPGRSTGGSRAGSPAHQPQSMKSISNAFRIFSRTYSSSIEELKRRSLTKHRSGGASAGSPLAQSPGAGPIQPQEIIAALPAAGIKIGDLMKIFQKRVGEAKGQTLKKEFIRLVKENAAFGADKLLRPK